MSARVKSSLALVLIFTLGMVTGGCLTYGVMPLLSHSPAFRQMSGHWLDHLNRRLNLTPDQQAKIQPILADAENQLQGLHREEIGRIGKIMEKASDEIKPLLTADQQVEFKKMESERERVFPRRGPSPGGGFRDGSDRSYGPGMHGPGGPPNTGGAAPPAAP